MDVAPDQKIILGLQIFLDHRSLSSIDQKLLMTPAIGSPWKKRLFPQKLRDVYLSDGDIYCFCFWQPTYISDKENCSLAQKPSDICFHKKGEQQLNEITFWIIAKRSLWKAFNFDKYGNLVIL